MALVDLIRNIIRCWIIGHNPDPPGYPLTDWCSDCGKSRTNLRERKR